MDRRCFRDRPQTYADHRYFPITNDKPCGSLWQISGLALCWGSTPCFGAVRFTKQQDLNPFLRNLWCVRRFVRAPNVSLEASTSEPSRALGEEKSVFCLKSLHLYYYSSFQFLFHYITPIYTIVVSILFTIILPIASQDLAWDKMHVPSGGWGVVIEQARGA